jgi:hypothetical protein
MDTSNALASTWPQPQDTPLDDLDHTMVHKGHAVLNPLSVTLWAGCQPRELEALMPFWDDMPLDAHLKDGGSYRRRRHSCFEFRNNVLTQTPHRAHWQSLDYNALHGGMHRMFEPISPDMVALPVWTQLLSAFARSCSQWRRQPQAHWCIEAHPFRIDCSQGIGRPTPEGAHRDGVDFVAVFLLQRHHITGGETRVFDAHGPHGERFTLQKPWSVLLLDDARVIHESTPIQPLGQAGHRDTLVLTARENAFQGTEQDLVTPSAHSLPCHQRARA